MIIPITYSLACISDFDGFLLISWVDRHGKVTIEFLWVCDRILGYGGIAILC